MSSFLKVYDNIRKELLSEQDNQQQEQPIQTEPIQGLDQEENVEGDDQENISIPEDETSEIKNVEEDSIKVDWIKKIIKLLTLLNREDETVDKLISDLSDGEVNADTLKLKENLIEELIRSIPTEKTS
jgi:hypothetical protein